MLFNGTKGSAVTTQPEVVGPPPKAVEQFRVGRDLRDDGGRLNGHRPYTVESQHDVSLQPAAEINVAARNRAVTKQPARGVRFSSRLRAWMLVPVADVALMLTPVVWRPYYFHAVIAMAGLGTILLAGGGLRRYRARLHLSVLDELPTILARLLTAMAAVAIVVLWLGSNEAVILFLEIACQAIALVVAGRFITTYLIGLARRRGFARCNTVLIGGGQLSAELAKILARCPRYGLVVDGFVDDGNHHPAQNWAPHLGRLADLDSAVATTGAAALLVGDGNFLERELIDAVRTKTCARVDLLVVPRLHWLRTPAGSVDHIGSIPVMRVRNSALYGPNRFIKRMFDITVAVTASFVLLPVLIASGLAVRIECGPGVVLRQVRVGRNGKEFELLKFRTLKCGTGCEAEPKWCLAKSEPAGPVGRFLRATSIDELPQLWNIIRGDMTIVGPRPERPYFVEQFSTQIDGYADRHRVRVGLTGFAQVNGLRQDTSIADRARYDNFYIENWSLWLDVKIVVNTFAEVCLRRGS
jgi:exopolysaccharide biosynthesis polyprenyl glycosylphosphotransferase